MSRFEPFVRILFAVLFAVPGALHLTNLTHFALSIHDFGFFNASTAVVLAVLLAPTELAIAAAFLSATGLRFAYSLTVGLLFVYSIAIAIALVQGRSVSCGCLGANSPPISWTHVALLGSGCVLAYLARWSLLQRDQTNTLEMPTN